MANRLIIGQWGYVRKTDFPCILKLLGVEDDGRLACVLRSLANGVLMFVFGLQSSYKAWVTEFLQDWLTESAIPPIYSLLFSVNAIKSVFKSCIFMRKTLIFCMTRCISTVLLHKRYYT